MCFIILEGEGILFLEHYEIARLHSVSYIVHIFYSFLVLYQPIIRVYQPIRFYTSLLGRAVPDSDFAGFLILSGTR